MGHRYLIDYDSTVADTQTARIEAVNRKFGTELHPSMVTSWYSPIFNDDHNAYQWGPEVFFSEEFQAAVPPVEGAIEGTLRLLELGNTCIIVSDRKPELFEVTREWLDQRGLGDVRLLFTRSKHGASADTDGFMTKAQAAWRHRLNRIIEDAPHHATTFMDKPWINKVYLLDMPYNVEVEHPKVVRCNGWKDVIAVVEAEALQEALV